MFCSRCGTKINDGERFCAGCGIQFSLSVELPDSTSKTKSKKILPVIAIVLVFCLVFSGIGVFLSYTNKPLVKIGTTLKNMLESGENYEVKLSSNYGFEEDCAFSIDMKSRHFAFECEYDDGDRESYTVDALEKIYIESYSWSTYDEDEYSCFYDDEFIWFEYEDDELVYAEIDDDPYYTEEYQMIFDVINAAVDIYEGKDPKAVITEIVETYGNEFGFDDFESEFDFSLFEDCLKDLAKCFLDTKWLEENLELKQEKSDGDTVYDICISSDTVDAILEIVEPAVKEVIRNTDEFDSYNEFEEYFIDDFTYYMPDIQLTIVLAKDYVKSIELELYEDEKIEIEITPSNKSVGIDMTDFKKKYNEAKELVNKEGYYNN